MANSQETTGEYVDGIVLNGVEHDVKDRTVSELAQSIDDEVIARQRAVSDEATARQNADTQLSTQISNEATARQNADNQLATSVNLLGTSVSNLSTSVASLGSAVESAVNDVNDMKSVIPSQASSTNKLVDQDKVASDIDTAVRALDVPSVGGSGKYISTISESDGKISATVVTMDTAPTASSTKACTSGGVKNYVDSSIEALDVAEVGGSGKYISAISETNGKLSATAVTMDSTPTASSTKACTSGGVKDYVDNQIATAITQVLNTNF